MFLRPLRDGRQAARRDAATAEGESGTRFDVRFFAMVMGLRGGLTLRVGQRFAANYYYDTRED